MREIDSRPVAADRRPSGGEVLLNLALYQLGWFAIVLGAARGRGLEGAALALLLVAAHLCLSRDLQRETALVASAGAVGLAAEGLVGWIGALDYASPDPWILTTPFWVLVLWLQFATLFHQALAWLSGRLALASLLGLVGAPLSFLAGERLGAATFAEPRARAIVALALVWAVALPALVWLADRLPPRRVGYRRPPTPA